MTAHKTPVVALLALLSVCYADFNDLLDAVEYPFACGHTSCSRDQLRQECRAILENIANVTVEFERCALMENLPFRMCESCVKHYGHAVSLFREIETDKTDPTIALCREKFFSSAKVSVVYDTMSHVRSVWNKASCDNCFNRPVIDNSTYEPSNDTLTFDRKLDDVFRCVNGTTLDDGKNNSTEVCTLCKEAYDELNCFYDSLVAKSRHGSICFETVAAMNRTRILWAINHCSVRNFSSVTVYITAALVGFLAILYYVCAFCAINPRNTMLVQREWISQRGMPQGSNGKRRPSRGSHDIGWGAW